MQWVKSLLPLGIFWALLFAGASGSAVEVGHLQTSPVDITSEIALSSQDRSRSDFENFEFKENRENDLKKNYSADALWIRFTLQNSSAATVDRVLFFSSGLPGLLELYSDGSHEVLQKTGNSVPYYQRPYPSRYPVFKITLKAGEFRTFFIKQTSIHSLSTKIFAGDGTGLIHIEMQSHSMMFFYFGGILCLVIYNLFVGIYSRDLSYFFYILFAGFMASAALNALGFFDAYLFPESTFSCSNHLIIFSAAAAISSLLFAYRFLNIPQMLPKSKIGFFILGGLCALAGVSGFFMNPELAVIMGYLIDLTIVCILFFLIICGVLVYIRGYRLAQFFLFSWMSVLIGVLSWLSMTYGILPTSKFTTYSMMFGNMGEMLILSLGLAYKINILDQEKREALRQAGEKDRYHRLVKVLSHDIANAIMISTSYLSRLRRIGLPSQGLQTVDKLETVISNVKDILGLVREEEAFKAFRLSVSLRRVDLKDVVTEVIALYEDAISAKGLEVQVRVPEQSFVMAEKTALCNQVFANLLSNAVKFSYVDSKISIFIEEAKNELILKVQDQGCGIRADDINNIFFLKDLISRPGTLKEKGTGLGLSLVKDYMAIFNGRIEVQSVHESVAKPSGTTVALVFPKVI